LAESQPTLINSIEVGEITANKITAGTIGVAEITLGGVNSIIKSSTYSPTSGGGWYIDGLGEFSLGGPEGINYDGETVVIGSNVQVTANLAADSISVGSGLNQLNINDGIGPIVPGSSPPVNVGGMTLGSAGNNYWYANGNFRVGGSTSYVQWDGAALSVVGNITATSGTFTGTVSGSTITGGSININSGVFTVSSTGLLTSTNANITGTVNAGSGTIAGIYFSAGRLFSGLNGNWANSNTGFYMDLNGYFSLKDKFFWNPDTNVVTFKGVLDGASGTIGEDFRIGKRLRVGSSATVTSTTVMRVQADGNTSTTRYPFVVEKLNGDNSFLVREDGRVDIPLGDLFVRNVQVSVSGHTHSYLPTAGGTVTGTLRVDGNFQLNQVASGTGIAQTTASTVGLLCFNTTAGLPNPGNFIWWKSGSGSSVRFKENIEPIADTVVNLQNFWNLKPVLFEYNTEYGGTIKEERPYGFRKHYGFIAEEVEELAPYLVSYDDDSLTDDVKYNSVFTVLYSEVKKMRQWLIDNHDYPG
jgi:hypothetical protein